MGYDVDILAVGLYCEVVLPSATFGNHIRKIYIKYFGIPIILDIIMRIKRHSESIPSPRIVLFV